jgi:hypothetical protein
MNLTDNVLHVKESAETGGSVRACTVRQRREEWVVLIYIRHSEEKIFRNFNYINVAHLTNFHLTTGIIKGGIISREERGPRITE